MEQTIKDFEMSLIAGSVSLRTVRAYAWELRRLAAAHPGKAAAVFTERDLNYYLANRQLLDGVGEAARKRAVAAFKKFFRWVVGDRRSPARRLEFPKVHPRRQRTLTREQLFAVLASFDTSTVVGKRNSGLIAVAVDSRLRESEICHLRLADVNLETRRLLIVVKGGHQHERAFSPETGALLSSWLSVRTEWLRQKALPDPGTMFVSLTGKGMGKPLTPDGLRALFRTMGKAAGMEQGFSPHDLCRGFATITTRNGAPTRSVQIGGGWGDVKLVETYTRSLELDVIEKYLPMRGSQNK